MADLLTATQTTQMVAALADPTTNQISPIVLNTSNQNATSPNAAENPTTNSPTNTPIAVTGNASTAATAIKKSNQNLAHACDSSSYVGSVVFSAGAIAGQIIKAFRDGIKALLEALGVSPPASSLTNKIKLLAKYISDTVKFINKITNALQQFIACVNAIKQLMAYILSLPAVLLKYFADCIKTLEKQLAAGYSSVFSDSGAAPGDQTDSLNSAISDVKNSIQQFTTATTQLAATAVVAKNSLTIPTTLNSGNTQAQAAATTAVFNAAGFTNASAQYGGRA